MNIKRTLVLTRKELKKTFREPAMLFMVILFPVMLTGAFGLAFGAIGATESTYDIAIIDNDMSTYPWGAYFTGNISESNLLNAIPYADNTTAQQDLIQGRIDAVLVIPDAFGNSCQSFWSNPGSPASWTNVTIGLYVDSGSMIASQALPAMIHQILIETLLGSQAISLSLPVTVDMPALVEASKLTQFDYMAPGLVAYASIFLVMTVAQSVSVDKEKGLLKRINTTPTTAGDVMASHAVANVLLAATQTVIIIAFATLLGFQPAISASAYLLAFGMALLFALCNVGFGLITATIARNASSATGISFIFILPQMFLGTFIPMSEGIARFVPSHYITDALTSLFLRGTPVTSVTVMMDLLVLVLTSISVFFTGTMLYRKFGSR
nr:ABC transporter permease [Candidatus Sigynarchaeota archaeon]